MSFIILIKEKSLFFYLSPISHNKVYTTQFYTHIFQNWLVCAYHLKNDISQEELTKCRNLALKAFEEKFNKQKSILIPYHKALWNAFEKNIEFEHNWLKSWLNKMAIIRNKLKNAQREQKLIFPRWIMLNSKINVSESNQRIWSILESYVHMTNNRLGILNRDEAYLAYLIKRSLQNL